MPSDPVNPSPTAVTEIVVNLDDVTGEVVGDAVRTLMQAGALDVWTAEIQMKKGRPGVMLSLLCDSGAVAGVCQAGDRADRQLRGSVSGSGAEWCSSVGT